MKKQKNSKWKMITLEEEVKIALDRLKIHPKESYQDVIKKLIELDSNTKIEKPEAVKSDLCSSYKSLNNQEMKGGSK